MKKQGCGKIINIASMSALIVNTESTYCVTKAAVAMLAKCLARSF
jgi:NAD(P)-dependent dehydrogenase (short-subunit alcohol dehydrogenase family)